MFEKTVPQRIRMIDNSETTTISVVGYHSPSQLRALCNAFRRNTSLEVLHFKEVSFSREEWGYLFEALLCHPTLWALGILNSGHLELPNSFQKLVHRCPNLRDLEISSTTLSDADMRFLFESINIEKIRVLQLYAPIGNEETLMDCVVEVLPKCALDALRLPIQSLAINQSRRLANALLHNDSLLYLHFDETETVIQAGALLPILNAVAQKQIFSQLTLGLLADEADYYLLADFLSTNPSLTRVIIHNELNPTMLNYMIGKILHKNATLCGFGYRDHYRSISERDRYRFRQYEYYLDDLTDANVRRATEEKSEPPESKKRKL